MQSFQMAWRPQVSYFDLRSKMLAELDEDGLMEAFHWENDGAVIVQVGPYEGFRMSVDGATCWIVSPRSDPDTVRRPLGRLLDHLNPQDMKTVSAKLRYVLPVNGSPAAAQRRFTADVASDLAPPANDAAVLLEGFSDELKAKFWVEYGIISADELEPRLTGLGRVPPMMSPFVPDLAHPPSCALFLTWTWTYTGQAGTDCRNIERMWGELLTHCGGLCERVAARHNLVIQRRREERA